MPPPALEDHDPGLRHDPPVPRRQLVGRRQALYAAVSPDIAEVTAACNGYTPTIIVGLAA